MRYVNGGVPVSRKEIVDETLPAFLSYYERYKGYGFWAAIENSRGDFSVGSTFARGRMRDRWNRSWATGCITSPGVRASQRKVAGDQHGFRRVGWRTVTAEAMAVNVASRRVMEKAGLRYVRTVHHDWPVRIPGDEHGDVEYTLDRADWKPAPERRETP